MINAFATRQEIMCVWGLLEPCRFTGQAYEYGLGVAQDHKRALYYHQRACALGSREACVAAGVNVLALGDLSQAASVLKMYEDACEAGSCAGCYAAGRSLTEDAKKLGIPLDVPRGRAYLAKACAARYLPACARDAAFTIEFKETAKYDEVRTQLIAACKLRDRESCHYLGKFELQGAFGEKSSQVAADYFYQACEDHWGPSCSALAYLHSLGSRTPERQKVIKHLTERACVLGHTPSCGIYQTEYPKPLPP